MPPRRRLPAEEREKQVLDTAVRVCSPDRLPATPRWTTRRRAGRGVEADGVHARQRFEGETAAALHPARVDRLLQSGVRCGRASGGRALRRGLRAFFTAHHPSGQVVGALPAGPDRHAFADEVRGPVGSSNGWRSTRGQSTSRPAPTRWPSPGRSPPRSPVPPKVSPAGPAGRADRTTRTSSPGALDPGCSRAGCASRRDG
ncbi:hypothetical protein HBB16_21500 [Pseudonocardia sp. MCCB 268]|nr:hypothetical protein [Pseudonocardia cytotoxica]